MKEGFLQAVEFGRGENLVLTLEEISRGEVYTANEALRLGLIDALGAQSDAIELAAQKAHIAHYHTVYLDEVLDQEKSTVSSFFALDKNGEITGYPKEPGFYYLYIPDVKGGLR
jgi:ClpP class serine protease